MLSGKDQPIKMRKSFGKLIFSCCEHPSPAPFHIHSQAQFRHIQLSYHLTDKKSTEEDTRFSGGKNR